jgi:DNA-binding NtrC family response regulator
MKENISLAAFTMNNPPLLSKGATFSERVRWFAARGKDATQIATEMYMSKDVTPVRGPRFQTLLAKVRNVLGIEPGRDEQNEKEHYVDALNNNRGSIGRTASDLNMSVSDLLQKINELDVYDRN